MRSERGRGLGGARRGAWLALLSASLSSATPPESAPTIDLGRLFADAAAWHRAADELSAAVDHFASPSVQKLATGADLLGALRAKDEVHRLAASVDGYLGLRVALDRDAAGAAALRPRMNEIAARWERAATEFEMRLRALEGDRLAGWFAATPDLAPYRWLVERTRTSAPRPPSSRERELLAEVDAERETTRALWAALALRDPPKVSVLLASGERLELTPTVARNLGLELADAGDRAVARRAWLEALAGRRDVYAALLGGVARREAFEARELGWPTALEARLADERIPARTVEALLAAARAAAPAVARYHEARRVRLGLERYGAADLRYPLAVARNDWSWGEARDVLLAAARPLGEGYVASLRRAFDEGWIDAAEAPGKSPVGFSTFVYGRHPFACVTFRGATGDLFRLAHELGHAVHHQIAAEHRPFAVARPSPLVGEAVAAVHELLLAHELAAGADGEDAVADLEGQTIERLFVATALDADFEIAAHGLGGAPSAQRLEALYLERLAAFHGGALALEPWDGAAWLETPHFFRDPFYMPRYGLAFAAGAALVEALESGDPGARGRFRALLEAGADDAPLALLRAAGADLDRPETLAAVGRRLEAIAGALEAGNLPAVGDVEDSGR